MRKLNVTFLHPDLGIGGAERLVVDAALAMKERGHNVSIITNHHSPTHCFEETRDGTLPVTVVGDWIPRTLLGVCYALFSYVRMAYAAAFLALCVNMGRMSVDVVFVDQVSVCVPLLKWLVFGECRVIFYCHFPDRLLVTGRENVLKRLYRAPLDWLEETTICAADVVLVNSKYTQAVFKETFKGATITPLVIYPSINTKVFDNAIPVQLEGLVHPGTFHLTNKFLLSVNRFERKKNLSIAVHCLRLLSDTSIKLVIAGGYDPLNRENKEYYNELKDLVIEQDLEDRVIFLKSPSEALKVTLLKRCICVLYTPSNEHFGIVPLEAMYCGKPVIAVDSGGPKETIVDGYNGYLCKPEYIYFFDALVELLDADKAELFGQRGRQRFDELFSFETFKRKINHVLEAYYERRF